MIRTAYGDDTLSRTTVHTCGFNGLKKVETRQKMKSRVKTMLNAFLDSKGLIHHEYVPFGQTVNGTFYSSVLKRLVASIHCMRPEYCEPGSWCLLHNNAKPHTAHIIQQYFAKNQITAHNHHPTHRIWHHLTFFYFRKLTWRWREHFFRMWTWFRQWWRVISRRFLSISRCTTSNYYITVLRTVSHVAVIMLNPRIVFVNKFYIWCPYEFLFGNLLDILCLRKSMRKSQ